MNLPLTATRKPPSTHFSVPDRAIVRPVSRGWVKTSAVPLVPAVAPVVAGVPVGPGAAPPGAAPPGGVPGGGGGPCGGGGPPRGGGPRRRRGLSRRRRGHLPGRSLFRGSCPRCTPADRPCCR